MEMKSVKLVSMLGAIGTFLAAGVATAATTESLMQQREGVAAEQNAKKLQISRQLCRLAWRWSIA
jgi:hypothetical protein